MRISDWSSDVCSSDLSVHAIRSIWCGRPCVACRQCSRRRTSRPSAARVWRKYSMANTTVKVRLVKGLRGCQQRHRLSVKALGLRKINDVRELRDSPSVRGLIRSEEHTSELQSLMRTSYAVFFLQKKKQQS